MFLSLLISRRAGARFRSRCSEHVQEVVGLLEQEVCRSLLQELVPCCCTGRGRGDMVWLQGGTSAAPQQVYLSLLISRRAGRRFRSRCLEQVQEVRRSWGWIRVSEQFQEVAGLLASFILDCYTIHVSLGVVRQSHKGH